MSPEPSAPGGGRFSTLLPFLILAAAYVGMAAVSWFRWLHPLVDAGRELYIPWRIAAGEVLYRDISHLYGPLAHYLNALLFTVFGVSLRTLVFFNLLLVGALTFLIYGLFRRACDRFTATLCGLAFLGIFAFSRDEMLGDYNFVSPYAHELTYGIFLFFLLVPLLGRSPPRRPRLRSAAAGALLGLIFLTKVEVFVAAFAAALAGLVLSALRARSLRVFSAGSAAATLTGFLAPPVAFAVLFSTKVTVRESLGMVVTTVTSLGLKPIVGNRMYLACSGLDRPAANAALMLEVAAVYAALALGVFLLARVKARCGHAARVPFRLLAIAALVAGCAILATDAYKILGFSGRPLPLFLLAHVLRASWTTVRGGGGHRQPDPSMISLSVFGLFLLPKIFLNVFFGWYGFALAMPAALLLVAGSAYHLPAIVRRRGGCGATARAACAVLVLLCIAAHARHSMRCYQDMNFPVGAGRDRFLTFDPFVTKLGPVFAEALAAIETHMPPDAGFVVIPEGVMLNYLARRRNPTRWFEFHPTYLAAVGENHVLDDLEAARPGYVVLTELKTAKLGADYFGTDYGLSLRDWIVRNYEPAYHAGDPLYRYQDFGIVIAKRNGRAAP